MQGYRGRHGRRSGHGCEPARLDGEMPNVLVELLVYLAHIVTPRRRLLEFQPLVHPLYTFRHLIPCVPYHGVTRRADRDVVLFTREAVRLLSLFVRLPVRNAGESEREDDDGGVSHGSLTPFMVVYPSK